MASFKIRTVFCEFTMYWQSKRYENKGKLWSEITLKSHAICVKLPHNLLHFTMLSDADSNVISVRLQCKIIEARAPKPWNGFAQAQKWGFYFYLLVEASVKKEEENKQKQSLTPNPSPRRGEWYVLQLYRIKAPFHKHFTPLSLRRGVGGEAFFLPYSLVAGLGERLPSSLIP